MAKPAPKKSAAAKSTRSDERVSSTAVEREPFDYTAFFKEGGMQYTEKDLIDVGGLMPIYASEHAFEEEWPPLFGLLVNRVEIEVDKANSVDNQRWRWFYVVEAEIATKALSGTKDDRETIAIEPGDYVLMPESGALKNRDRLKIAACDPDEVHRVLFRVEGEPIDLGKPGRNPMWPVESKLVGDPIPRKGRYVISNTARNNDRNLSSNGAAPALPPGTVLNRQGQPQGSLVG